MDRKSGEKRMLDQYQTIETEGIAEVVEKKSRFIGMIASAATQEEAEAYIEKIRKKHYDARHHCFAYVTGEAGTPGEIQRFSDDGEPQGTAGKPMLEVLRGYELHNTVVVVTRYFGGTLLGTGGLLRAYTKAAQDAYAAAGVVKKQSGVRMSVKCSYTASGKLTWYFANENITVLRTDYGEGVEIQLLIPDGEVEKVRNQITEFTDGSAEIEIAEKLMYTVEV